MAVQQTYEGSPHGFVAQSTPHLGLMPATQRQCSYRLPFSRWSPHRRRIRRSSDLFDRPQVHNDIGPIADLPSKLLLDRLGLLSPVVPSGRRYPTRVPPERLIEELLPPAEPGKQAGRQIQLLPGTQRGISTEYSGISLTVRSIASHSFGSASGKCFQWPDVGAYAQMPVRPPGGSCTAGNVLVARTAGAT
jgi:hypothetical protein